MNTGRHFEEFEIGAVYPHRPGRTITQADNIWFSLLTLNQHPLHCDEEYGRPVSLAGASSAARSPGAPRRDERAGCQSKGNRQPRLARHPHDGAGIPRRYTVQRIRGHRKTASKSRPEAGIVTVRTTGRNQDGRIVCVFERTILVPKGARCR